MALYARTVRHLKPSQIASLLRRRIVAYYGPARNRAELRCADGVSLQESIATAARAGAENEFRFLNVTKKHDGKVDWISADMTRLWRYNLHYFDYIIETGRSLDGIARLVSDWISSNPMGRGEAWEPYTVSLRIVNWVKLFLRDDFRAHVRRDWLISLHDQARWLEANLEHHLLGNHYVKNGKALLYAGVFFAGADADRWQSKGLRILLDQAREQLLDDGGHFERSPMYHSIVTQDYLDALNVASAVDGSVAADDIGIVQDKITAALDFLHDVCLPDGSIPLFNDSAFGIAPSLDQLARYAASLFGYALPVRAHGLHLSARAACGYFAIRDGDDVCIIDCGDIGPDYQPGHGHCDCLSFELAIRGRPVIVDSGTFDYERSEMRRYVRSTRAHNTVMVDRCEQSEVWDVFRVGRRARPLEVRLEEIGHSQARFRGSHDGYHRLPGAPRHLRTIDYGRRDGWKVRDVVSGTGRHLVESFIHLHPDLDAHTDGPLIVVSAAGRRLFDVHVAEGSAVSLTTGWYCPRFGVRRQNTVIRLCHDGPLPASLEYRIVDAAAQT